MKKSTLKAVTIAGVFALAASTGASAGTTAEPSAGGISSGPLEYIRTVPIDAGAAQVAKKVDDFLYLTSWKALSVYDVSDLLNPVHVSTIPTGFQFPAERMDTNGEVLVIGEESPVARLHVFDVSDPSQPNEIATLDGVGDHTVVCILDCRWVYGSHGSIVDLADPADPQLVGQWSDPSLTYWHDII